MNEKKRSIEQAYNDQLEIFKSREMQERILSEQIDLEFARSQNSFWWNPSQPK